MRAVAGVTLIELIVALALIGIMAAVTGLAIRRMPEPDAAQQRADRIVHARREAIDGRRVVVFTLADTGAVRTATAFPDGRVVADSTVEIDPLTGRPDAAAR